MNTINIKNTLLMSLMMSTILLAQNTSVCKIDGESVPDWVCNTKPMHKSITAVGSSNSSLVKIGFRNNSKIGQTFKKADKDL